MAIRGVDTKHPNSNDFQTGIDWSPYIGSRTIGASAWIVPDGITKVDDDFDDTATAVRLAGGAAGKMYVLKNTVVLSDGQDLTEEMRVDVSYPMAE